MHAIKINCRKFVWINSLTSNRSKIRKSIKTKTTITEKYATSEYIFLKSFVYLERDEMGLNYHKLQSTK